MKKTNYKFREIIGLMMLVFLIVCVGLNLYFYVNLNKTRSERQVLLLENEKAMNSIVEAEHKMLLMHQSSTTAIMLSREPLSPITLYWNKGTSDLLLLTNDLQSPPSGQQYQVWALDNSLVVDAGTIKSREKLSTVVMLKPVREAQSFFITLENEPGAMYPDLNSIVAKGTF